MLFGLALTVISTVIGVAVGALQGFFGGKVDLIGQRIVEIWSGLPVLFILIILASMVEPNVYWLLGILALFSWMAMVGLVRAEFLRARNFEFVRAARSLGVGNVMWGSDYPHREGTYPDSVASLRHVFHDWEPADLHELFGGTAAKLYGLDIEPMAALELGPTVDEIATPLDEIPDNPSMAFGRRL